jgi:hypothetical protein
VLYVASKAAQDLPPATYHAVAQRAHQEGGVPQVPHVSLVRHQRVVRQRTLHTKEKHKITYQDKWQMISTDMRAVRQRILHTKQ